MMRLPIRTRLTFVYSAISLASIAMVELGVYWGTDAAFESILDHELRSRRVVVEEYVTNHIRKMDWPQLSVALAQHRGFQPEWIEIRDADNRILFRGEEVRLALETPGLKPAHIRRETRLIGGTEYLFTVGLDSSISTAVLDRLRLLMLLTSPLIVLVASLAGYWIAGRALRPVDEITRAARSIGVGNLSTRIAVPRSGDEIERLADTMNGMLERIEGGFRQIGQFTANASHELRTPMAIIRSTAEVGLMQPVAGNSAERRALERILRQAELGSRLLEDMLHLARLDSGAARAEFGWVELAGNVREALREAQPLFERQGLTVQFRDEATGCGVLGEAGQLRRLWTIVLDNAAKYTPPGGRIEVVVAEGCCRVQDWGVGIAAKDLPHIFERFYRADMARHSAGAGLGLALARQIADVHEARIEVESVEGQGAVFSVKFAPQRVLGKFSGNPQVPIIALQ